MKGMALILYNNIEYAQAAVKDTKGWKIGGSKIKASALKLCFVILCIVKPQKTVKLAINITYYYFFLLGGLCKSGKSDGFLSFNAGVWPGY